MNKLKLFIENFIVYGLSGAMSAIIPFIMTPIVTRMIPEVSVYGVSDITGTIVSLGTSLAIMGMYDAMYRYFFDDEDLQYRKRVCSTVLCFLLCTGVFFALMVIAFRQAIAQTFMGDAGLSKVVFIAAFTILFSSTNSIVSAPTRMQNKRKVYLVMNVCGPLLSYAVAIPMLLRGHYLIALPLSAMASAVFTETVFGALNHQWFDLRLFDKDLFKGMVKLALPLMPTFLMYWVFHSCDRLMISNLIGIKNSGIYASGAKLAMASQLIYTAFAGGWQFFAFSTMNEDGQVESNSRVFEYLAVISFFCGALMFALTKPLNQWFFDGDYELGYTVTPYLFLAPLLLMLYQTIANQFLVVKITWPGTLALLVGAIANVALNALLIPRMGIEGAAIATLMGYVISLVIVSVILIRMRLFVLTPRSMAAILICMGFIVVWRLGLRDNFWAGLACALVVDAMYVVMYRKDVLGLARKLIK